MSLPQSIFSRSWLLVLVFSLGYLTWSQGVRIDRLNYVTGIAEDEREAVAGRRLIVPEHLSGSFSWVEQVQQMFDRKTMLVRRVDSENAPFGREVRSASLYRWWMASVAWVDHVVEGIPLPVAVERAAVLADPALQMVGLLFTTLLLARLSGGLAAALNALGWVWLFPLGEGFLPGVPDDHGIALVFAVGSVLAGVAGLKRSLEGSGGGGTRWLFVSGLAGGAVLWISVSLAVPLWLGMAVGAVWAARLGRAQGVGAGGGEKSEANWTAWGWGGGAMILAGVLIDGMPERLLGWELRSVHPIYALAWVTSGYGLRALCRGIAGEPWKTKRILTEAGLGIAGIVAVYVAMTVAKNQGFLAVDLLSFRLTKEGGGAMSPNLATWLTSEGLKPLAVTAFLSVLFLVFAGLAMALKAVRGTDRGVLAYLLGTALVAVGMGWFFLRWWQVSGAFSLLTLAVLAGTVRTGVAAAWRWSCAGLALVIFGIGAVQVHLRSDPEKRNVLTIDEVEGLVERDLARWLVKQSSPEKRPVVLAPPNLTAALSYYGGVKGLGSLAWENKDGLSVALRMVISTSRDEALVLLRSRGVTHLMIPSWDPFFENYTKSASVQAGELFWPGLKRWVVPLWLRPVPYQMPGIPGFEEQSVVVFEIVDEQSEPLALSRMTEYFIEMGQVEAAKAAGQGLSKFPADFGALVTRAQLAVATGDQDGFGKLLEQIVKRLGAGADRSLAWDRRVSLSTVLARGKRLDLAKVQAEKSLGLIDESRLRSLTTYSLFHFQFVCKAAGLGISDPALKALALDLLPGELSAKLR